MINAIRTTSIAAPTRLSAPRPDPYGPEADKHRSNVRKASAAVGAAVGAAGLGYLTFGTTSGFIGAMQGAVAIGGAGALVLGAAGAALGWSAGDNPDNKPLGEMAGGAVGGAIGGVSGLITGLFVGAHVGGSAGNILGIGAGALVGGIGGFLAGRKLAPQPH
ncbi:MAG: hypothetical protein ACYCW6_10275 [Candidatus Xenobia bacterium]